MSDNMASKLKRKVYAKKATGYVVLGAIALVFVFFGYSGNQMGTMGMGSVARVNDALIPMLDFQNEENRIEQYYNNMFGGALDLGPQRSLLRRQALDNLVRAELVAQAARRDGILATDAEVREFITKDIPVFQENGRFIRDRYMGYLQSTRSTPSDFEDRVRKDIANLRTRHLVEVAASPLAMETAKIKELRERQINVGFARLSADELIQKTKVAEADAKAKLADPEFLKKAEEYFKAYKADWSKPETVTAQHILVSFKPGDAESERAALEKAKGLQVRAAKEDFGKLASQFSEDPGSKDKKGDLGTFGRGKMVKEFEDVAFTQKPGQVSDPVKSPFGYHLIKVSNHTPGQEPAFADVQVAVASRLLARDQVEAELKVLDEAVAQGDAAKIDALVKSLGGTWQETGYFDLATETVPRVPPGAVAEAVFEVSAEKPVLNRVVREGGARYLVKFQGQRQQASAEAPADAADHLKRRRAEAMHSAWLDQYREKSHVEMNTEVLK